MKRNGTKLIIPTIFMILSLFSSIGISFAWWFVDNMLVSNVTGKIAYITNVYTRNEYRKQGIATKLLELIIDEIKYKGCKFVRLHASSEGKKLYEKIGFRHTGESDGDVIIKGISYKN